MNDIKEMWVDMFPNWEFKEVFKLRKPDIDKNICEEISYHGTCLTYGELVDTINGIYSEARNVQKENRALKQSDNITDLETEIMQLKEERKVFFEIVDSFIRGVESEKGIAPENERFQYAMDQTLNWMTRLREDLKNPNQYLKLRKQLEKENKMFLVDKEKENNMF